MLRTEDLGKLTEPSWFAEATSLKGARDDPCLAICESAGQNAFDLMAATLLAVEDGRTRVRVRLGDDRRDPSRATELAQELKCEGISFIVGHFGSVTARPASSTYGQHGMLFLAPGSSDPGLCGQHAPTTLQFFGKDTEQVECLARAAEFDVPTLVVAQRGNYGAIIANALLDRLLPRLSCLEAHYLEMGSRLPNSTMAAKRIIILGSHEFALRICGLERFRDSAAEILLSDDCYTEAMLTLPLKCCRVAFLAKTGSRLLDRCESEVVARAKKLLGRLPGPYFITSYLALRALIDAWRKAGPNDTSGVRADILQQTWASPYGELSLSRSGSLTGYRWEMIPTRNLALGSSPSSLAR